MAYGKSLDRPSSLTLNDCLGAAQYGVPYPLDKLGHEYTPAPPAIKRDRRSRRNGTWSKTGALPRGRHAFIRKDALPPEPHRLIRTTRVSPSLAAWRAKERNGF